MSDPFINYLKSGNIVFKDYAHASRLYRDNKFALAPKLGFLYYVVFNINENAIIDKKFTEDKRKVGLLVKRIDLPKFQIKNEKLNQYNRKTVVQTKIDYSNVQIEFHDDNSDVTNRLWMNYYKHYYVDSNYGDVNVGSAAGEFRPRAYGDTKYGPDNNAYGLYNNGEPNPFFNNIEIYVLHQGEFTKFTLVNPIISEWRHDTLNQSEGNKLLSNSMSIDYENVFYKLGKITKGVDPATFGIEYYDPVGSPYEFSDSNSQSGFDNQTKSRVFGVPSNRQSYNPLFDQKSKQRVYGLVGAPTQLGALGQIGSILLRNIVNKNGLGRQGPTGYNIASGVLGRTLGGGAGKYAEPVSTQQQPGIFNLGGGVGINIFKGFNTSVDGKTRINPAAIILPPRG